MHLVLSDKHSIRNITRTGAACQFCLAQDFSQVRSFFHRVVRSCKAIAWLGQRNFRFVPVTMPAVLLIGKTKFFIVEPFLLVSALLVAYIDSSVA